MTDKNICPGGSNCYGERIKFEDSIKKTLFGINGIGGVVGNFISKKWIFWVVGICGLSVISGGYSLFLAKDSARYVYADQKENAAEHHEMRVDIAESKKDIQANTKAIEENTEAIKNQNERFDQLSIKIDAQTNVILEAIHEKENNKEDGGPIE